MSKQQKKKQLIINSFVELVKKHGLGRVNFADVAESCGLSKSALYYYFDSKEILLTETLQFVFSRLNEVFKNTVSEIKNPEERLRCFIEFKLRIFVDKSYTEDILSFSKISHHIIEEVEKYIFASPAIVEKMMLLKKTELKYLNEIISEIRSDLSIKTVKELSIIIQRSLDGLFEVQTMEKKLSSYNIESFEKMEKELREIKNPQTMASQLLINGIKYYKKEE
ncbi:MAG: TetR/AcrR family transcriptional regulator [bacterium]